MKQPKELALIAITLSMCLMPFGCADNSDGLTAEQKGVKDRFETIMQRSGGKWENLTPEDKKYVVDKLSNGNEQAAQQMFRIRASRAEAAKGPGGGQAAP